MTTTPDPLDDAAAELRRHQDALLKARPIPPLGPALAPSTSRAGRVVRALFAIGVTAAAVTSGVLIAGLADAKTHRPALGFHDESDGTIAFTDGSRVRVDGKASVLFVDERGATLRLDSGTLAADLKPQSQWAVEAGPYALLLKAGRVDAAYAGDALTVHVLDGGALLSAPGQPPIALAAGATMTLPVAASPSPPSSAPLVPATSLASPVSPSSASSASAASAAPAASAASAAPFASAAPGASAASPASPAPGASAASAASAASGASAASPASSGAPSAAAEVRLEAAVGSAPAGGASAPWQLLARADRHAEAVTAAKALGLADVLAASSADDLILLGTSARLAMDIDVAEAAYGAVRARFPSSSQAALAAFFLGRIAADIKHDDAAAVKLLRTSLAETPQLELSREAQGRLVEILARTHAKDAGAEARVYLERWPDGPHAALARTLAR